MWPIGLLLLFCNLVVGSSRDRDKFYDTCLIRPSRTIKVLFFHKKPFRAPFFFLINWTVDIDHCSLSPHVLQHSHNKCFVSQNRKCTICQYICLAKMEIHCLILYRNVNFTVLFCMYFQRFPIFWFLKCVKGIFLNN